ncbi:MAG: Sec-independent protein translocase protein TatB [Alphaproteobacteria bacterium]
MFDIGWIEMAVIALIALVVIGPNELPKAMRSLAKWTRKARSMAREFQSGIDDMVREADLDEARKAVESAKSFDVGKAMEETIDPTGGLRDDAKELEDEMARDAEDEAGDGDEAGGGDEAGDAGTEAPGAAESSAEEVAGNAAAGAIGIGHPADKAPPEPEPEPEPVAVAADGDGSKQRA